MYQIYNLTSSPNVKISDQKGPFTVITHLLPLSRPNLNPVDAYFDSLLQARQRQLICSLKKGDVNIGFGMIQWMVGDVRMNTNVRGPLSFLDQKLRSSLIGQSSIVSRCTGSGEVILEPVSSDILLVDMADWMEGIVLESDMFLACTQDIALNVSGRTNLSSLAFGQEGAFNLTLNGQGTAALMVPCSKETIVEVVLQDDEIRLEGHFAIAWSSTLHFSVESAGQTIPASVLSGEGIVNVYRGSGKILLAPIMQPTTRQRQQAASEK